MNPPVLIVDSDGKSLAVLQRKLRKDYDAQIALGARMGLQRMNEDGPYAVVIAEYGMQPMDGVSFLSKVHENWPNTTRILISRITLETSVMLACINDAKIFHILPNIIILFINYLLKNWQEFINIAQEAYMSPYRGRSTIVPGKVYGKKHEKIKGQKMNVVEMRKRVTAAFPRPSRPEINFDTMP